MVTTNMTRKGVRREVEGRRAVVGRSGEMWSVSREIGGPRGLENVSRILEDVQWTSEVVI